MKMNNMDYKYIEQLLERYFAAETTLQEEQILRSFFSQEDSEMPENLRQYAPLFEAMVPRETLDDDFDERLLAMTEEAPVVEARIISLSQSLRPLFSAAAVVAILLTLAGALNLQLKSETTTSEDIVMADVNAPMPAGQPNVALGQDVVVMPADTMKIDSVRAQM